jgi:histidinol-phosphate aminotransferase
LQLNFSKIMTTNISRRLWLQRSAMAAAVIPISRWYDPNRHDYKYYSPEAVNANGALRLNLNENAYGPSEAAKKAIVESLSEANRYPRQFLTDLKKALADREGLTPDHVIVTSGSTELLGLAGLVFGMKGGEMVACHPTFDFLLLYAEKMGCTWARTPLDEHHQTDLKALDRLVGKNTKLIFVCNPNNPTGVEIPYSQLRSFCETYASTYPMYIDEAYIELSGGGLKSSMASLIEAHPKLIVARTFSKVYGLAGMRIGYALGHPDIIKQMADLHTGRSTTLSAAAAAAALACLKDSEFENFSKSKIAEGKSIVSNAFSKWGVDHLPSATNFVFFKNDKFNGDPVKLLAEKNIFIRSYDYVPGWSRVSIGTTEEMNTFVTTIQKFLS